MKPGRPNLPTRRKSLSSAQNGDQGRVREKELVARIDLDTFKSTAAAFQRLCEEQCGLLQVRFRSWHAFPKRNKMQT